MMPSREATMKKIIISISHCELNTIIDALSYAIEQTESSAGDIQAFCKDAGTLPAEENLCMAGVAKDLVAQFIEVFKDGSKDFIIDVNDTTSYFTDEVQDLTID